MPPPSNSHLCQIWPPPPSPKPVKRYWIAHCMNLWHLYPSAQCLHIASNQTITFLHARTLSVRWSHLPLPLECPHTIKWLCFMYYKKKHNVIWVTRSQTYLGHEQLHLLPQELGTCQFEILQTKIANLCKIHEVQTKRCLVFKWFYHCLIRNTTEILRFSRWC